MIPAGINRILTVNSGSSSLKLALYEIGSQESLIFAANVNRIGEAVSYISEPAETPPLAKGHPREQLFSDG